MYSLPGRVWHRAGKGEEEKKLRLLRGFGGHGLNEMGTWEDQEKMQMDS